MQGVYTMSRAQDWGNFANLSDIQFVTVLSKFSGLRQWMVDIINNNGSCGALLIITGAREPKGDVNWTISDINI